MGEIKRPISRHSGIRSQALLEQVRNTAPFLFDRGGGPDALGHEDLPSFGWLRILRDGLKCPVVESDLWSYFDLCISAHFATVGTFVPTDVDLAIREKLWSQVRSDRDLEPMWRSVLSFYDWDEGLVSKRIAVSTNGEKISGHQGEWLTIAMGAYGAAKRLGSSILPEVRARIEAEVAREERALISLKEAFLADPERRNLKPYLAGIASVIHNLGDLDRMIASLELEDTDVLKRRLHRSGHEDSLNPRAIFLEAGVVYKALLASENHRHFALRTPKGLRTSSRFLLPYGPFLEEWGAGLVKTGSGLQSEGDLRDAVEALATGWVSLNPGSIYTSTGYARALWGMMKELGSLEALTSLVPPSIRKLLNESGLRTHLSESAGAFERKFRSRLLPLIRSD
jgi:hypothetical protein